MGHVREKYTTEYYLHRDRDGNPVGYGAGGLDDFHDGRVRDIDRDILERIDFRGTRVLDIGCGRGEAMRFAAEARALSVHGIDFSDAAVEIARSYLNDAGIAAEVHCADALHLLKLWGTERAAQTFDVVLMLDCVEHIPRAELTELLAALRPQVSARGILVINTPAFGADNDVITEGLNPDARDDSDDFEETAGMHCNRYTCRSLKAYLRRRGFAPLSHHLFAPHWRLPRWREATPWALRRAVAAGHPILLPRALEPEMYSGPLHQPWRHRSALAPLRRWKRRLASALNAR